MDRTQAKNEHMKVIGDVCEFFAGGDSFRKLEYSSSGIPVLAKGDVKPYGRIGFDGKRYVEPALAKKRGYRLTEPGDILLTTRDLTQKAEFLGLVAHIPEDTVYCVNQGANIIRLNDSVDMRYFVYWCNGPTYRAYVKSHYVGSTQIHMRKSDFLNAPIWLPEMEIQKAIASMLGSLDDTIDSHTETIAALDRISHAVFKSWFVDFDPVRAKAEGKKPFGMDDETAALFPDSFEDSELGPIPQGWEVRAVADCASISRDVIRPDECPEELFCYYSIPAFDANRMPLIEKGSNIKSAKLTISNESILVSKLNPRTPRVWRPIPADHIRSICSTEFLPITAKNGFDREYLYSLVTHRRFTRDLESLVTGTSGSHQRVRASDIMRLQVISPPLPLIRKYGSVVLPFRKKMDLGQLMNATIADVRDTLLPGLLTGVIQIIAGTSKQRGLNEVDVQ